MKKVITAILLASFLSVAAVFASASPVSANGVQKKPMVERKEARRRHRRRVIRHHRRVMRRRHRKM